MAAPRVASVPFTPELPCQLGDYELLSEIGRGGMGVIYKARQCCLDRLCAVKMLRQDFSSCTPEAEAALTAEAAAAGSLDHPNIVGIYEVGREQGHLFFSMEFVEGEDLAKYVRSRLLDLPTIARWTLTIARAVAYAHGRGVMHHDLKPANVVIDSQGQPQITDFGLARRVDEVHRGDPARGAGSPNFLAPEQASARFGEPSLFTDVYGLGAILYFLLTDRPPHVGVTPEDTIAAVLETEVVPPRLLRPGIPVDLETICLRCLNKVQERRYASASDVANELERFLDDRPIRARPAGWIERGRKWCRRHPAIAALGSVVMLLLAVLAFGASVAAMRIDAARDRAERSEFTTRRSLYNSDMLLASTALAQGNDGMVRDLLKRHTPAPGQSDLRGWEWRHLDHATAGDFEAEVGRHSNAVAQIEVLQDGVHVLACDSSGWLRTWDIAERRPTAARQINPIGAPIFARSRTEPKVATVRFDAESNQASLLLLTLPDLEIDRTLSIPSRALPGAFGSDDRAVWLVESESVQLLDLATGSARARHVIRRPNRWREFAFSPEARRFAYADPEGKLHVIDLASGRTEATLEGHPFQPVWGAAVYSLAFSSDDSQLVSSGTDGLVKVWNVARSTLERTITGHSDLVMGAAISPDDRWIVSGGRDSFLLLAENRTPVVSRRLRGADSVQTSMAFLPEGDVPVSGGLNGSIRVWRRQPREIQPRLTNLPAGIGASLPLECGDHFLCANAAFGLSIHRMSDGTQVVADESTSDRAMVNACETADGRFLIASVTYQGLLQIREFPGDRRREIHLELPRPLSRGMLMLLEFSRDGRWLAVADLLRGLRLIDVATLEVRRSFQAYARTLAFSPRGTWLAAGSVSGALQVWRMADGKAIPYEWSHAQTADLVFSPDEAQLASVSLDGSIRTWDLGTGRSRLNGTSSAGPLYAVAWAMDESRLFAGALNGSLVVWDAETGRETFVGTGHQQPITGLRSMPDGALISFSTDSVLTWPAPALARPETHFEKGDGERNQP
ncbi:MAG: protein kinase [Verrucomicrobiales bacterium]|nr:protein kinase [Verrucomicrobiales bacterium]